MAKSKTKKTKDNVRFPKKLLVPVGNFLQNRLKDLEKRRRDIDSQDPFKDKDRVTDNAIDTDAAEQFGHARTSALREGLDRKIIQTKKALTRVKVGKYGICEDCGKMIDTDRLMAYPEATLCIDDERKREN